MTNRFEGSFHQSGLKQYQGCGMAFNYDSIIGIDREKTSWAALAGTAAHDTVEYAHDEKCWDMEILKEFFLNKCNELWDRAITNGRELIGTLDEKKFLIQIEKYISKPWNREARMILHEAEFYLEIKPFGTTYVLEGRIDQLLGIPTDTLRREFPRLFMEFPRDEVIIHRDLKTGQRRNVSPFELALDIQFDVYALALKDGLITMPSGEQEVLNLIPNYHVKYHTQDHIPYADDKGAFIKDDEGNFTVCDIVSEPCLVGKKQEPCKGKRKWCTKQVKGPAMYFTSRPEACLKDREEGIGRICANIRRGAFTRHLGDLCFTYCAFRTTCEAEAMQGIEVVER